MATLLPDAARLATRRSAIEDDVQPHRRWWAAWRGDPAAATSEADDTASPSLGHALRNMVASVQRSATGVADARDRFLAQSVDHADFANRRRAWDAHEERSRLLPPVL